MPVLDWGQDKDAIINKLSNSNAVFRLCCKTHDEPLFVRDWIMHHANIVGLENLIIADNMSTDAEVMRVYDEFSDKVLIFRFDGDHNDIHGSPRFSNMYNAISNSTRYFMFCDVDERLVMYRDQHLVSDHQIIDSLLGADGGKIIPSTWIVNCLASTTKFSLNRARETNLFENFKWGKPIVPGVLAGVSPDIHNIHFKNFEFDRVLGTRFFLLHLTQFTNRRINTNIAKLRQKGLVPAHARLTEVLNIDFGSYEDQSFMPLVDEIRKMVSLNFSGALPSESDYFTLENDKLVFSNDSSKTFFSEFLESSESSIESIQNSDLRYHPSLLSHDIIADRAQMLEKSKHFVQARQLLIFGEYSYPEVEHQYGGPKFKNELLRLELSANNFTAAQELLPEDGSTWHEVLFARAYDAIGDSSSAVSWWMRILDREKTNLEAINALKRLSIVSDSQYAAGSLAHDLKIVSNLIDKSIWQVHDFMTNYCKIKNIDTNEAVQQIRRSVDRARVKLLSPNDCSMEAPNVPKIIHKVWLSPPDAFCCPPEDYVNKIRSEVEILCLEGWTYNIWTNSSVGLDRLTEIFHGTAATIRDENVDLPYGKWRFIYNSFLRDRKFPFAADVLRMIILDEFGGVYCDMGAHFTSTSHLSVLTSNFDYGLIFWENLFFQNSLMFMPRKSLLAGLFHKIVDAPYRVPKELIQPLTGLTEGQAFAGPMITALMLEIGLDSLDICPLAPNAAAVRWSSQQSWYKRGEGNASKFGNAYIPETEPSFYVDDGWSSIFHNG